MASISKCYSLRVFVDPNAFIVGRTNYRHIKEIKPWTRTREHCSVVGVAFIVQYRGTFNDLRGAAVGVL